MSRSLPYRLHGISITISNRERLGDIYIVTARAKDRTGREDESTGAVTLGNLKGDALCNALMKAETKAKRRVTLSIAGLGWLDETELETIPQASASIVTTSDQHGNTSTEDIATTIVTPVTSIPSPVQHPTADEITTLVECARAANVDLEAFGHDMRRLMQLSDSQKITKKFLREHMTLAQYNTARAHYGEALRVILEEDVPDHEPAPAAGQPDASEAVSEATEGTLGPFVASSSAPAPDAEASAARDKLRQEAIGWSIAEQEVDHIVTHHPLETARTLLWKGAASGRRRVNGCDRIIRL